MVWIPFGLSLFVLVTCLVVLMLARSVAVLGPVIVGYLIGRRRI